jgi:hypothetical protein
MHDGSVGRALYAARVEPQHAHKEVMFGRNIGTRQYRKDVDKIGSQACLQVIRSSNLALSSHKTR